MVDVDGEHLPGMTHDDVTTIIATNSRINIFPSLIIDRFVNLQLADFQSSGVLVFNRPITRCAQLRHLSLYDNLIRVIPARIFQNCGELKFLRMGKNFIDTIHREAFIGLSNVVDFSLSENLIRNLNPEAFAPLTSMLSIQLDSNDLFKVDPAFFRFLPNLQSFSANNNPLETWNMPSSPVGVMHGLVSLSILGTKIPAIDARAFDNFKNLRFLWFGGSITSLPTFIDVEALEELRIDGNQLTNVTAEPFRNMPSLRKLSINSNSVENINFSNSSEFLLQNLQELSLQGNRIERIDPGTFTMLTNLTTLTLTNNLIENLGEESIRPISQLRSLHVSNNKIKRIDREMFRGVRDLLFVAFGNVCVDQAFNIRDFADFEARVAPMMEECFSFAPTTRVNFFAIIFSLAITFVMKM